MHLILQLLNRLKSKNKSYHSKENTTLKLYEWEKELPKINPIKIVRPFSLKLFNCEWMKSIIKKKPENIDLKTFVNNNNRTIIGVRMKGTSADYLRRSQNLLPFLKVKRTRIRKKLRTYIIQLNFFCIFQCKK